MKVNKHSECMQESGIAWQLLTCTHVTSDPTWVSGCLFVPTTGYVPLQAFLASTQCSGLRVLTSDAVYVWQRSPAPPRGPNSPLWDMPTDRHFWKRQYWHLLRFFFWILQRRSHLSYSSFRRIVRRKKPLKWGKKHRIRLPTMPKWDWFFPYRSM